MNKLIIIESGDQLGKNSLIKGICEYYSYNNITIRHFDKPHKTILKNEILDYQFKCFKQEFELVKYIQTMNKKFMYHDNIIIYNRSYLGEFVYGQEFRNYDSKLIKNKILALEIYYLKRILDIDFYLITLTADPDFFLNKEDGKSFSQNLEQKTKELKLFKEAFEFSLIKNKKMIKVDKETELQTGTEWRMKGPNIFRTKEEILQEVLSFINQ